MAVAADLDRATDSKWDWVAEQTRTYLASGGTEGHESNGLSMLLLTTTGRRTGEPRRERLWSRMVRIFPLYAEYAQQTDRVIPVVVLTPQD